MPSRLLLSCLRSVSKASGSVLNITMEIEEFPIGDSGGHGSAGHCDLDRYIKLDNTRS